MAAWNREANEIFLKAVEIESPDDRRTFLQEACHGKNQLRGLVDALIAAGEQAGSFLESPHPGLTAAVDPSDMSECPGSIIGNYKLLEQIGEGGMGVVYMADQMAPVHRRVALKIIKPGMDTRQVIARFEAERQALALMDHPNIARVLDAGATDSSRPYFVMELVRGIAITDYCDQNNLSVEERLELFVQVCQAVQHAHQKGIIHRDLKPSNVLVTLHDGRPVPKVIDFGVAKATNQQLTEKTLFTAFAQMIGTPLYMSPEQAEMTSLDIDTRSDVYSLGVLLYELLTGTTPFDKNRLREAAYDEIRRIIREEEPQKPSTRLSSLGATRTAIAAHRKADPERLSQLLCGDLDWIVMKSLEKDRTRRYETANGLARDVQRYLSDQPVEACPPSAGYRFRKFARRNRAALMTGVLISTVLVLGVLVSTWQAIRATRSEHLAETARMDEAQQRRIAEDERIEAEKQRALADTQRNDAIEQRRQAEANFQQARKAVDEYFTLVSENKLLDVPGLQPLRKDLLEAALRFYQQTAVERTSDPGALADVAVTHLRVAIIDHFIARNDEAFAAIASALDVIDRLRHDYPNTKEHQRRLAGFWKGYRAGQSRSEMPKNPLAAFKTLQRAIQTWQDLVDKDPDHPEFQSDLASLCYFAGLLMAGVNERESLRYYERSKELLEKLVVTQPDAPEHRADLARVYQDMVGKLVRAQRPAEAEAAQSRSLSLREVLVSQYPNSPQYRGELATILSQRASDIATKHPAEAEPMFQRAVDLGQGMVREFPDAAICHEVLAAALGRWEMYVRTCDKPDQKERFQKTVQDLVVHRAQGASLGFILSKTYTEIAKSQTDRERQQTIRKAISAIPTADELLVASDGHFDFAQMAELLAQSGQSDEAVETVEQFIEVAEARVQATRKGFTNLAHTYRWLSVTRGHEKEYLRKAIAAFDLAILDEHNDPKTRSFLADTLISLGQSLKPRDENGEAESCFRRAKSVYEALVAEFPDNREYPALLARSDLKVIEVLFAQDKPAEAEEAIQKAVETFGELAAAQPAVADYWRNRASLQRRLARAQASANRNLEAKTTYLQAIDSYERTIAQFPKYENLWLVYLGLAQSLAASDRPREADEARRKAVELAPEKAETLNTLAWTLATCPELQLRNSALAVKLARKVVELEPLNGFYWQTLGVAQYRAGEWKAAISALEKVRELGSAGDSLEWFPLAMAQWQLNNKVEARKWHDKAVEWMETNQPANEVLLGFRAEAVQLLGSPKEASQDSLPAAGATLKDR